MKKAFLSRSFICQKSLLLVCLFLLLAIYGIALCQTVTITTQVLIDLEEEDSVSSQENSFSASPSIIEIEQVSGGVRNFTISLSNTSQEQIQVKTMVSDITQSPDGEIELVDASTTTYSIAPWLINKGEENLILAPGEIKKIPFQLTVPPDRWKFGVLGKDRSFTSSFGI